MTLRGMIRLLALLVHLSIVVRIEAQDPPAPADDYELLIADAVSEYEYGNFFEARTLFARAHELRPSARTLRGLGFSDYELKRYVRASAEFTAALLDARNVLTDVQRSEVSVALERANRYVGRLVLDITPEETIVTIDGLPTNERALDLDVGKHVISVSAPDYQAIQENVMVLGGQTVHVQLVLIPVSMPVDLRVPPPPLAASTIPVPGPSKPPADEGSSIFSQWWFWTLTGVVVASATVATVYVVRQENAKAAEESLSTTGLTFSAPH
ncbi:MAG TPA: PEGA domain-containing protein [Polyangiales bacterium]|nr:PEGA domain-containing protein [Polyangiales bacterium]